MQRRTFFHFAAVLMTLSCGNDIGNTPRGQTGGAGGSGGTAGGAGAPDSGTGHGGSTSTGGNGGSTGGTGGTAGGVAGSTGSGGSTGGSGGSTGGSGGSTGGTAGTAGKGGTGGSTGGSAGKGGTGGSTGGSAGTSGTGGSAGSGGTGGSTPPGDGGICGASVRVTEIDVGGTTFVNEDEAALMPLAIAPIPSGGARLAWMDKSSMVHVTQLDANDQVVGTSLTLPAHDFGDLYADDAGGVLMLTRDATGGGTGNCGTLTNLCGSTLPTTATCFDMYMVRFDGTAETWATKLTDPTSALPPYSTGPTGPDVVYIWSPYAHHARIAFDGSNYAGYFGAAISVSQMCTNGGGTNGTGINVHQGDRMKVVSATGALQTSGFGWGCSHSGYERIAWDPSAKKFVTICKTDNNNRIAFAPNYTTIFPVDLYYSNLANIVVGPQGGYWTATSNIRSGQPANANGLADVHLLHFTTGAPDKDVVMGDAALNNRAVHLASYGATRLLAAWETSSTTGDLAANDKNRKLYVQAVDAATGAAEGTPVNVPGVVGNRYQEFKGFPDGSAAYPAPGSSATKVKIVRAMPCP